MNAYSTHGPQGIIDLYERLYAATAGRPSPKDIELLSRLHHWPNLIETIGVLHNEKVLGTDIVYKMWGPQINIAWEVYRLPVKELRRLSNAPITYRYFQELAAAMLQCAKRLAASEATGTPATESRSAAAGEAERNGTWQFLSSFDRSHLSHEMRLGNPATHGRSFTWAFAGLLVGIVSYRWGARKRRSDS